MDLQIVVDPLTGPEIAALLREHLDDMYRLSPPECVHALDLAKLRQADVTFWSAWTGAGLLGCAALRELDGSHGEIKSMRTAAAHRGRGVAGALMRRILEESEQRGYSRLSLETGSQLEFAPARALYRRYGFDLCGPFASYAEDPFSTFMTRTLAGSHNRNQR